jgi:hypothetical protein
VTALPVDPTDAQIQAVLNDGRDGPVVMINLNRYRDRDAYLQEYGLVALAAIDSVGGRILWQSEVEQVVIGDDRDQYDEVIAVWYPNRSAFLGLMDHPALLAITPPPE